MKSDTQTLKARIASAAAVFVLTAVVGLCSAFIIYITGTHFNTQKGWTVCALSVGSVSAFVGCCWYRIFTEPPKALNTGVQEQPTEGVWPPPPTTPNQP